LGTDKIKLKTE